MAKQTQAELKAKEKYNKANTLTLCIRLNKNTDQDIIEFLECLQYGGESKQGLIKRLLRGEIEKSSKYIQYLNQ